MATGKMILDKIQIGQEAVAGDGAADARVATAILAGAGTLQDASVKTVVDNKVGYSIRTTEQFTPMKGVDISLTEHYASFEQLGYFLDMALGKATPAQDGVGSGYVRTYPIPSDIQEITDFLTLLVEGGDNNQEYQAAYCFMTEMSLSMKKGDAWMRSASLTGQEMLKGSFTGSLSAPTLEKIMANNTALYIDAVSGTIGTTLVPACTLLTASLAIATGLRPFSGDADLAFACAEHVGHALELDTSFRYDANAVSQEDNYAADTPILLQLKNEGSDLGTTGTTYSKKTLIIDLAGVWGSFKKDGDENGVNLGKGKLLVGYDPTAATAGQIILVNELSTLP